jgi:hypothetical protein
MGGGSSSEEPWHFTLPGGRRIGVFGEDEPSCKVDGGHVLARDGALLLLGVNISGREREDGHDVFGESHRCRGGGASSACDVGFAGRLFKGIEYVNELITLQ